MVLCAMEIVALPNIECYYVLKKYRTNLNLGQDEFLGNAYIRNVGKCGKPSQVGFINPYGVAV